MISRLAAPSIALALTGCVTQGPASVAGGECKVFERPPFVVAGRAAYDQTWIDGSVEAGVAACGWKRPEPRPPTLEKSPAATPPPKPVRRGFKARVRELRRSWPGERVAPIVQTPVAVVIESAPVVSKPATVAPIDELLGPIR